MKPFEELSRREMFLILSRNLGAINRVAHPLVVSLIEPPEEQWIVVRGERFAEWKDAQEYIDAVKQIQVEEAEQERLSALYP